MVARRGGARQTPAAFGEELVVCVAQSGPGRDDARAEVERYDEAGKARAAEMSSSKSGTSASS